MLIIIAKSRTEIFQLLRHPANGGCKVKIARYFAEKLEPMGEQLSASSIEKAWNRYRAAAPYIYAFYSSLYCAENQQDSFAEAKKITEEDWIGRIAQLATKSTLEECLDTQPSPSTR